MLSRILGLCGAAGHPRERNRQHRTHRPPQNRRFTFTCVGASVMRLYQFAKRAATPHTIRGHAVHPMMRAAFPKRPGGPGHRIATMRDAPARIRVGRRSAPRRLQIRVKEHEPRRECPSPSLHHPAGPGYQQLQSICLWSAAVSVTSHRLAR